MIAPASHFAFTAPAGPAACPVQAGELSWGGAWSISRHSPHTIYTLLGSDSLRALTSSNFDTLVATWLKRHPTAVVVNIEQNGQVMMDDPKSEMDYVWIVDQHSHSCLNETLVRQGACEGGTMLFWKLSQLDQRGDPKSWQKILVGSQEYRRFQKRIAREEQLAQRDRYGIWQHGTDIDND